MKQKILHLALACLALLSLCSCGELFESPEIVELTHMELDRHEIVLMNGDQCKLSMLFSPETITNESGYWTVNGPKCVSITQNGLIHADSVGHTQVQVKTVQSFLTDLCKVCVFPNVISPDYEGDGFPYDMVIYAEVKIQGKPLGVVDGRPQIVLAYCNDDYRGYGELCTDYGISYVRFRIGSFETEGDYIRFVYYDRENYRFIDIPYGVVFDGEQHGTLSNLESINLD